MSNESKAIEACRALVAAYAAGEETGSVEREDLDSAHALAVEALAGAQDHSMRFPRVSMRCEDCGSLDVERDASVYWDENAQEWALFTVYDAAECRDCGSELYTSVRIE